VLTKQEHGFALKMWHKGGFKGIVAYGVIILIQFHQQVRACAIYSSDLKNTVLSLIL
jgi:hypothetical protein